MLPRKQRIARAEFQPYYNKGRSISGRFLSIRCTKISGPSRVAVVVSKKVAKLSVDRHRLKRRMYDAIAPLLPKEGMAIIVYPKKEAIHMKTKELLENMKAILPQ